VCPGGGFSLPGARAVRRAPGGGERTIVVMVLAAPVCERHLLAALLLATLIALAGGHVHLRGDPLARPRHHRQRRQGEPDRLLGGAALLSRRRCAPISADCWGARSSGGAACLRRRRPRRGRGGGAAPAAVRPGRAGLLGVATHCVLWRAVADTGSTARAGLALGRVDAASGTRALGQRSRHGVRMPASL